jgi:hypothetical protein
MFIVVGIGGIELIQFVNPFLNCGILLGNVLRLLLINLLRMLSSVSLRPIFSSMYSDLLRKHEIDYDERYIWD